MFGGVSCGLALLIAGCTPATPGGFDSPDPNLQVRSIVGSGSELSAEEAVELVEKLDSVDPAARMLAIRALERATGTTRGYDHAQPAWRREDAVRMWADWLVEMDYRRPQEDAEESVVRAEIPGQDQVGGDRP